MTVDSVFLKFSNDILQGAHAFLSLCNNNPVMKQCLTNQHFVSLRNIIKGQANMIGTIMILECCISQCMKEFHLVFSSNSIVEYNEMDSV